MTILNRYLAKEIGLGFFICLFSFLIFLLIGKLLHLKDFFLGQNISLKDIGELFLYLAPSFLIILVPASCMISVFLVFLKMSSERELLALKTSGMSYKQFFFFPLGFSFLCVLFSLYTSFFLIPKGIEMFREKCINILQSKTQISLQPGIFISNFPGITIYCKDINRVNNIMKNIFIVYKDSKDNKVILSSKGKIQFNKNDNLAIIDLSDGNIYNLSQKECSIIKFNSYKIGIDLKNMFSGIKLDNKKPKEMYFSEIKNTIKNSKDSKIIRVAKMELQRRIALPFSCLILVFFTLPFAFNLSGIKQQFGVIFCLLFFIIYYSLYLLFYSFGETGKISPSLAMWMPNIIFLILSIL
ncbi:LptF/LptG family permease, partial [Desulfonauticus submarinus]